MLVLQFWNNQRGNFAVAAALLALPLILATGTAADVARMTRAKSELQAALDAATMAVALKVPSNYSEQQLAAWGDAHLKAHIAADTGDALPDFHYLGLTSDGSGTQYIGAKTEFAYDPLMADVFRSDELDAMLGVEFELTAQVSVRAGDPACVYALSRTAPRALEAGGNTDIATDGCVFASNSSAPDAIYVDGSASLVADCLQSSGGIQADGGLTVDCAANRTNAWPLADPFRFLPEPLPSVLFNNPNKQATSMGPGRYRNLTLDGTKTLAAGLYYIEGDLSIKGTISGTGVTIFMKDGAITINGGASVSLSAPESGDYAGMLFMSAADNTSAQKFNGGGTTLLDGYLYFPKGDLTYSGNNSTSSTCLRMLANTITMTGSSVLRSDCTQELGGRQARVSGPLHFTR